MYTYLYISSRKLIRARDADRRRSYIVTSAETHIPLVVSRQGGGPRGHIASATSPASLFKPRYLGQGVAILDRTDIASTGVPVPPPEMQNILLRLPPINHFVHPSASASGREGNDYPALSYYHFPDQRSA